MANRRDDYMNRRSWLIDTAETPADQKRLKSDLAKLDAKFNPNKVAKVSKAKPEAKKTVAKSMSKKTMPKVEGAKSGTKKPMPKVAGAKPSVKTPMPKVGPKPTRTTTPKPKTTKKPEKMTPQDAAMKKILEKKYGKIYG